MDIKRDEGKTERKKGIRQGREKEGRKGTIK